MKREEYQNMYENDSSHWWFLGLGEIILGLLEKFLAGKKDLRVLDAGCGTCWLTNKLSRYGEVYALDLEDFALNICKDRGIKNITKADVEHIPLPDGFF